MLPHYNYMHAPYFAQGCTINKTTLNVQSHYFACGHIVGGWGVGGGGGGGGLGQQMTKFFFFFIAGMVYCKFKVIIFRPYRGRTLSLILSI